MGDKEEKKDDKKKKEEQEEVDMRLEFMLNYLIKAMRLKQEKWNKMLLVEDNKVRGLTWESMFALNNFLLKFSEYFGKCVHGTFEFWRLLNFL